jgi:hypothetical protein
VLSITGLPSGKYAVTVNGRMLQHLETGALLTQDLPIPINSAVPALVDITREAQ